MAVDNKSKTNKKTADKKSQILKKYAGLAKKLKRNPKLTDLKDIAISKDMVVHHFGSLTRLHKEARELSPDSFFDMVIESLYSQKALSSLRDDVKKYSRFVITTAVTGCQIHDGFYASLKNYCSINDAALLILVSSDPSSNFAETSWGTIDTKLKEEAIVMEDTSLNNNLFLSTIKLSAKHIDPITGLGRIGQRNGTFVYASPKQRLKAVAVGSEKLPHFMMTTGAITKPNYRSNNYQSQRTSYIAENDHVIGAVIVEIEDKEIFHFRQVQADSKGHFPDLGIMYTPNNTKTFQPDAFILGDWHSGSTDPTAAQAWKEVCELVKPKTLVLHDLFDGRSISHHEEKDIILRSQRSERGELGLAEEIEQVAKDLDMLLDYADKLVIVKSNHDMFLDRYLREAKYAKDPINHRAALNLAAILLDGMDPLKTGVESYMEKDSGFVKWLKMDEDYKIAGVQLGAHGHAGANGARGSLDNLEEGFGSLVCGHSHTPGIQRAAWQVGTSSYLKLPYVKGASSWVHSSVLLYSNGSRQMINSIGGKWKI